MDRPVYVVQKFQKVNIFLIYLPNTRVHNYVVRFTLNILFLLRMMIIILRII